MFRLLRAAVKKSASTLHGSRKAAGAGSSAPMAPGPSFAKPTSLLAAGLALLALAGSAGGSSGRQDGPTGRIAVGGDGDVIVVDARNRHKRRVAVFVQSAPAWSANGRHLAYVADGALRARAMPSGGERTITGLGGGFSVGPSWSPRGARLAFTLHGALDDEARLVVVSRSGRERRTVDRTAASLQVPSWSPDGRRIAYLRHSADGAAAIWTVRPDGGGRRLLARGAFDYPDSLSWSPDGGRIAFVGGGGSGAAVAPALTVLEAGGTRPRAVAAVAGVPAQPTVGSVRWSPAGRSIAFLRWGQDGGADALCLVDPQTRRELVLAEAPYIDDVTWSPDGRWLAYLTENPSRPSGLPFSLWVIRADGSGKHRLARLNEQSDGLAWGRSTRK
jgi:TolB protein